MNDLIVIAFDHFDAARIALTRLRTIEADGRIQFEDTALIERDPDGTVHVRNEVSGTTEKATAIGAVIGGILGFAIPLAGMALGAAAGALVGRLADTGVSDAFVNELKETLRPGRSAVFLVIKQSESDATLAALRDLRGEVVQTTLSGEAEQALRDSISRG